MKFLQVETFLKIDFQKVKIKNIIFLFIQMELKMMDYMVLQIYQELLSNVLQFQQEELLDLLNKG